VKAQCQWPVARGDVRELETVGGDRF
jgi:hypothetical protein